MKTRATSSAEIGSGIASGAEAVSRVRYRDALHVMRGLGTQRSRSQPVPRQPQDWGCTDSRRGSTFGKAVSCATPKVVEKAATFEGEIDKLQSDIK